MAENWKEIHKCSGYRSLKAEYIRNVQNAEARRRRGHRPMRDKAEYLKHFNWIIGRAKHYAHETGLPITWILNLWESKRKYCWLNFYQNNCQPKFHSKSIKRRRTNLINVQSKKSRWSMSRKQRMKELRNL